MLLAWLCRFITCTYIYAIFYFVILSYNVLFILILWNAVESLGENNVM